MNNFNSEQSKEQVDAFEILARALPDMIRARAENPVIAPKKPGQMGYITQKVANNLGVEICSIFLLEVDTDSKRLVLAEAHGYDTRAVGDRKSLDTGLTAMIAGLASKTSHKEPTEMVCNFTVQDHVGWSGQLDSELTGHGWTLLGVPIVGANRKPKGVIKLENKKSVSHSDQVSTLLGKTADKRNTPGEILKKVQNLHQVMQTTVDSSFSKTAFAIGSQMEGIAHGIVKSCGQLSCDIAFKADAQEESIPLNFLDANKQEELIASLQLQTSALSASLDYLQVPTLTRHAEIAQCLSQLRNMLAAFGLALKAYTPFLRSDVLLVRAVAALIAAAIDISENTSEMALHQLQHGLKGATVEFLQHLASLTEQTETFWTSNKKARRELQQLWLTGLNISGPQDALGPNVVRLAGSTLGKFVSDDLDNRLHFYQDCTHVWGKTLNRPNDRDGLLSSISESPLPCPAGLLIGVCDILFCNAVQYGGDTITVDFISDGADALLVMNDNGPGIQEAELGNLQDSQTLSSGGSRFGLKAAKRALEQCGLKLEVLGNGMPDKMGWTRIAIRIPMRINKQASTLMS